MDWMLIVECTKDVSAFCHKHDIPMHFYDYGWAQVPARVAVLNMLQQAGFKVKIV